METWLNPVLRLETELHREHDRHLAAQMSRDQLNRLADRLICQSYHQQVIIEQALNRVAVLEIEQLLAQAPPTPRERDRRHFQWAKELLGRG